MKHLTIIIISLFILQGCFTAVAGFNAGGSNNDPISSYLNKGRYEKKKTKANKTKEIYGCRDEEEPIQCTENTFRKKCETEYFDSLNLYYDCKTEEGVPVFHYFVIVNIENEEEIKIYTYDFPQKEQDIMQTSK